MNLLRQLRITTTTLHVHANSKISSRSRAFIPATLPPPTTQGNDTPFAMPAAFSQRLSRADNLFRHHEDCSTEFVDHVCISRESMSSPLWVCTSKADHGVYEFYLFLRCSVLLHDNTGFAEESTFATWRLPSIPSGREERGRSMAEGNVHGKHIHSGLWCSLS